MRFSDWQFPDTLNPFQAGAAVDSEIFAATLHSLVDYDAKSRLYPVMITQVPSLRNHLIRDGGKTIVLRLKHGLRWSDGAEITSADVKFGWRVGMDAKTGPSCRGTCDVIAGIDTPDAFTAVLHLKHVFAPAVPDALPAPWPHKWGNVWSDPGSAAAKLGQDRKFNFEGPGYPTDGAYQVVNFIPNDRIILRPMKHYTTMNCGAAVATLIFAFYSSKDGMIAAAINHDTNVTTNYTPADLTPLLRHRDAFHTYSIPTYNYEHLELNVDPTYMSKPNPLHNTKVRLAMALAIDKLGLIQSALAVNAQAAKQLVAWTPWINTPELTIPFAEKSIAGQWDPIVRRYIIPGRGPALSDARRLLSETPWESGFTTDFVTTSGNPTRAQEESVIAASLQKIGISVNPTFVPASHFFAGYDQGGTNHSGQFQITMFTSTLSPDFEDIKYHLESSYVDREAAVKSALNLNYSGIKDQLIDDDLTKADLTYNRMLRAKYYSSVQREINQKAYWNIFYFRPDISTADGRAAGIVPAPTGIGWNMYAWRASSNR